MHHTQIEQTDSTALRCLTETFPFAAIAINGKARPLVAQASLTFRDDLVSAEAVEFHLARQNVVTNAIDDDRTPATIVINGPALMCRHAGTWRAFQMPHRSRTAPTYVTAALMGDLQRRSHTDLQTQIADLVADHEPDDGWRFEEIDPELFRPWYDLLACDSEKEIWTSPLSRQRTFGIRDGGH
ncbi:hypothetical protein GR212_26735 [Rhizobium lusitanum]|uniref:Uncharacterized protein n=1 Tax=Rhizobium lusitanum TaxID=293958 RepID=A0A6L9UFR5_9HYPH|nr:FMN-binding negative transcriptional regulator [Rhizobium lusitanum]NEI73162.1 hypothetical protein [Rhizobium lusitanum]